MKAVYFDAWDSRAPTADDPYVLAVSGDLARVSFSGKACTLAGPKQVDRRLVSQELTGKACAYVLEGGGLGTIVPENLRYFRDR